MLTRERAEEILRTLATLPPEKLAEVHDFALFLKERCAAQRAIDETDVWTEQDIRDVTLAALAHADATLPGEVAGDP